MTKIKQLKKEEVKAVIAPNFQPFFEEVVKKSATIIVDTMKSCELGDRLKFSCDVGTEDSQHTISIEINKK